MLPHIGELAVRDDVRLVEFCSEMGHWYLLFGGIFESIVCVAVHQMSYKNRVGVLPAEVTTYLAKNLVSLLDAQREWLVHEPRAHGSMKISAVSI